ncbi:MAG TPA: SPOR domain-containing protein [Dokdonella sp.]|uniref:SPOR domain-containing protein n=1 Tax=Dokdonella sp. TaxID=2291710 RepID=UPI002D8089FC|nr:SPOR domain-containing protein [Dokdonella sp.]HET9033924.1 SPOR domain-containing protein [Dokdonella sp.]
MKQRLLGAVVLIALAIIFLPMLFSGSAPKQDSVTTNMEIPPQPTREFETRVLAVDTANKDASRLPEHQAQSREPVASVDTQVPPRVEVMPEAVNSIDTSEPPSAAIAKPVSEATTPATVEQVEAGKAADGKYLVHLGVYAASGNASDLVAQLKKSGFPAFAESVDYKGKPAKRVRVGPFTDRAEAEAARIRIKQVRSDVPSSIVGVAEDAKADAPATAVAKTAAGAWAVQLGAFATVEDANKLKGRLSAAGFVGFVDKFTTEGKTLWRVRAGPEIERANAEKLRDQIKDKLKMDGLIVTQP